MRPWTSSEDALLGSSIDSVVAKQIGRSTQAVTHRRLRLGIKACNPPQPLQLNESQTESTKSLSESQAAKELGVSRKTIKKARERFGVESEFAYDKHEQGVWSEDNCKLLGSMTDGELAKKLGVSRQNVRDKRVRSGIAPFRRHTPQSINLSEAFRTNVSDLLSKNGWTQTELALRVGFNRTHVSQLMTGHRNPGLKAIEKFAAAFRVSPSRLLKPRGS